MYAGPMTGHVWGTLRSSSRLRRRLAMAAAVFLLQSCALFDSGTRQAATAPPQGGGKAASSQSGKILEVGPGKQFTRPSQAAKAARDGDVIEIAAGTYAKDAAVWRANNLTIRGVGGRAHMRADGADAEDKGIWVIKGATRRLKTSNFPVPACATETEPGSVRKGPV